MPKALLDLQKILEALSTHHVKFILVGGLAGMGHGMNYVTEDLDVCYERSLENYEAIVKALSSAHPKLRTPGEDLPFLFDAVTLKNGLNFTFQTDWGPVDFLGELQGIGGYADLKPSAVDYSLFGISCPTISLDDLIRAKKIAGRTKDKLHLLELEAIRELLNQGFLKGDKE